MTLFNELMILFYVVFLYLLSLTDLNDLEANFSLGKFLIILSIIQKIGNSVILCLLIWNKISEHFGLKKTHSIQSIEKLLIDLEKNF